MNFAPLTQRVTAWWLNLNDLGTEVPKNGSCEGTCKELTELDNSDA
jgi:hypothetical protein